MFSDPELWVAVGFVILIGVIWRPASKTMTAALDRRSARIRETLDEAQTLADEAQHLLAEHQRKQRDSAAEVEHMMARAREDAERIVADSRAKLEAALRRREQMAEEKIALAEAEATREVRDLAVEVAVAATRALIAARLDVAAQGRLIDSAIAELPNRLH